MVTGDHPLTGAAIARQVCDHNLFVLVFLFPCCLGVISSFFCIYLTQVGIIPPIGQDTPETSRLQVIEGREVESLTEEDWEFIVTRESGTVFARTTPQHKLDIVRKCRSFGAVVGVTGDGVNDAPAMKAAHIGEHRGFNSIHAHFIISFTLLLTPALRLKNHFSF